MNEHHKLSSEKYYVDKLETEYKMARRNKAKTSVKTMITFVAMFSFFAVCGYALFMHPTFVPDSVDYMRANGILSY